MRSKNKEDREREVGGRGRHGGGRTRATGVQNGDKYSHGRKKGRLERGVDYVFKVKVKIAKCEYNSLQILTC